MEKVEGTRGSGGHAEEFSEVADTKWSYRRVSMHCQKYTKLWPTSEVEVQNKYPNVTEVLLSRNRSCTIIFKGRNAHWLINDRSSLKVNSDNISILGKLFLDNSPTPA